MVTVSSLQFTFMYLQRNLAIHKIKIKLFAKFDLTCVLSTFHFIRMVKSHILYNLEWNRTQRSKFKAKSVEKSSSTVKIQSASSIVIFAECILQHAQISFCRFFGTPCYGSLSFSMTIGLSFLQCMILESFGFLPSVGNPFRSQLWKERSQSQ